MSYALLSIVLAAVFLAILILLHFLKPELDPSWRMISEYEIGRFGWLMRLAFFGWGASLLALLICLWPSLQLTSGMISRAWFILIVLALIGAGIFKTNPITDRTPSLVNTLHTLCGAIVILTFPIAATLAVSSLLRDSTWPAHSGILIFVLILAWVGMVAYFASVVIARVRDPKAGEPGGPIVYQGWPNRFMVLTYIAWISLVAATALRL
jgi:NAD/NADP transhydrogenase beta subunit